MAKFGHKQSPETIAKRKASIAAWRAANPEADAQRQAKCAAKLKAFSQTDEFARQSSERMRKRHADPEWQKVRDARSSRVMKQVWRDHREKLIAVAVARYAAGIGLNNEISEAKKRTAAKWIMKQAHAALRSETEFEALFSETHNRLRREMPYEGPAEGADYIEYLRRLAEATNSDPAVRALADAFMSQAIPRFAAIWRAGVAA